MTRLTEHFSKAELTVNQTEHIPLGYIRNLRQLAKNLEVLRQYYGLPIYVTSGYRSESYNKKVGGARRSQHLYGKAADIVVKGRTPIDVKRAIELLIESGDMQPGGLAAYKTFVHYDIRGRNARWNGSSKK